MISILSAVRRRPLAEFRTRLLSEKTKTIVFLAILLLLGQCWDVRLFAEEQEKPRILIFTKMTGYVHVTVPECARNLAALCDRNGIASDITEDAEVFSQEGLKKYRALIFLSCSGKLLTDPQKEAFQHYIRGGGGFVGIHAASTQGSGWSWYQDLVGAKFVTHPWVQPATLTNLAPQHPANEGLPSSWVRSDEWYEFENVPANVTFLLQVSETRWHGVGINEKGTKGGTSIPPVGDPKAIIAPHAIAWCHEFEGGRAFYTAMGHFPEAYLEPEIETHLISGIRWAGKIPAMPSYRVLIFNKCMPRPYVDKAIPEVTAGLQSLGQANGYQADVDSDGSRFTAEGLKPYKVIVMLNSCGKNLLDESQRQAMKLFVNQGGGVVGIHAVAYTAKDWPWLGELLGATLDTDKHFVPQTVTVMDQTNPATAYLPTTFIHKEQWFRFVTPPKNVQILMTVDGSKLTDLDLLDTSYPLAWCHEFDGGRAFFTTFGHETHLNEGPFLNQILGAISWAKGK
ncbi:MAG: ThuA domain-containing protein [Verrucomicrobiota bacterium]